MAVTYSLTAVTRLLLVLCLLSGHDTGIVYKVSVKLTNGFYPAADSIGYTNLNMNGQRGQIATNILQPSSSDFQAGGDLYKYQFEHPGLGPPVYCVSIKFLQSRYGTTDMSVEYLKVSYIEEGAMYCHVFHFPSWPGGDMYFSVLDNGTCTYSEWPCSHH